MKPRGGERNRLFLIPFSLLFLPALAARPADGPRWTVLLSGDADGYLAPCGCTSPMSGGLKRRTTVLRRGGEDRVIALDNGGLAGGTDRQHVFKAETAAQALDLAEVDAANLAADDARLGPGEALSLVNLSGRRLVSTSLRPTKALPIDPWREAGPFLVGGATARPDRLGAQLGGSADEPAEAAHRLAEEAAQRGLVPVMLFDGDQAAAKALARAEPALRLVTYRTTARPSAILVREGECALASPGEHGKSVVRLTWEGAAFASSTTVQDLGPGVADDRAADVLYRAYLRRVEKAGLLDAAPHVSAKVAQSFVGSERCSSCHVGATKVWRASGHAHALTTLEEAGHQKDPDCVPCHVVGASNGAAAPIMAFRSRASTPRLANVGCESCHGPGASHAASPWKSALPKISARACLSCHSPENSPNFDFAAYWPRVRHGLDAKKTGLPARRP